MTIVLAGFFGNPANLEVPPRSIKRIQRSIYESEERLGGDVDRLIEFQAITTIDGSNISQLNVVTSRIDGEPVYEKISILYRNGRFKSASAEYHDGTIKEHTLAAAISRIGNPLVQTVND
jgi:hypothetical protein